MQRTNPGPIGSSPDNPIYFRFLRDDNLNLDWKKISVMLAVTALTGFIATQSQRAGSSPDQMKLFKMSYHRKMIEISKDQVDFWAIRARHHAELYDISRL